MKNITVKNFFRVLKCPICREPLEFGNEDDGVMCRICRAKWEVEKGKLCVQCGLPAANCRCMPELMSKAKVEDLLKLCFYETESGSAADRFILYMKDNRDTRVFDFAVGELWGLLNRYFDENSIDSSNVVFTYAPRSRLTLDQKGFDQAEILARKLSKRFGASFMRTISRKYFSRRQKGLDSAARLQNSKNSFGIKKDVKLTGRTVVLIDDVVTTAASLSVCAKMLRAAGARSIICASIALTDSRR